MFSDKCDLEETITDNCYCKMRGIDKYFYNSTLKMCQKKKDVSHCCNPGLLEAFDTSEECNYYGCNLGEFSMIIGAMPSVMVKMNYI